MDRLECFARNRSRYWEAYCPELGIEVGGGTLEDATRNMTVRVFGEAFRGIASDQVSKLRAWGWKLSRKVRFEVERPQVSAPTATM